MRGLSTNFLGDVCIAGAWIHGIMAGLGLC